MHARARAFINALKAYAPPHSTNAITTLAPAPAPAQGGPCALWASCDSDPKNAGASYWCGENCAGGGAGEDSHMSKTGWLGLPLGVSFNQSSKVFARMQSWKSAKGAIVHAWMDSSWYVGRSKPP